MILLRHAQSHFNLHFGRTRQDPGIEDPELTEEGLRQAEAAARLLRREAIGRILASPYTRTLQTASIIADALNLKIEVEPLVREQAFFTCDIGTPRSSLQDRYGYLDFSCLEEIWWSPGPESEEALQERCKGFRGKAVASADWRETLVVTHWAFVRGLTGQTLPNGESLRFDPTR